MMASTSASRASVNFSPPPEKTLMPLSWNGLWEAEMTRPAAKPWLRVRCATAGVGMTPALTTDAPAAAAPMARSRSIGSPDSRVSRPTSRRISPPVGGSAFTSAMPRRRTVRVSSGGAPARPRTPSVPNSFVLI